MKAYYGDLFVDICIFRHWWREYNRVQFHGDIDLANLELQDSIAIRAWKHSRLKT
jgi:hypothetical protein